MFSSISRGAGSSKGTPSSTSRVACAMQATISEASASDSCAVACTSQMRTSTVPKLKCGRTDHQTCVNSTIELRAHEELDVLAIGRPAAERVGHAAAREALGEALRARRVQTAVAPVEVGRVGRDREQQRQHRAQAVADADRAVDVAHADVHVQAERVVAPGDVLQPLLDAAVVLGVDDRLLAVVGPRVRAGCAERDAAGASASANRRLRRSRWRASASLQVAADAGDDLDLRGDQLAGDALVQQRIASARDVAQLLEARQRGRACAGRGSRTPPRRRP